MREAVNKFFDYVEGTSLYIYSSSIFDSMWEMGSNLIQGIVNIPEWLNYLITGVFLGMTLNSLTSWFFSSRARQHPPVPMNDISPEPEQTQEPEQFVTPALPILLQKYSIITRDTNFEAFTSTSTTETPAPKITMRSSFGSGKNTG